MIKDHPHIGIAYNAYEPVAGRTHERISEESVEKAAEDVFAAVTKLGYDVVLIPLKRSIENFIRRIKNARIDVIVRCIC